MFLLKMSFAMKSICLQSGKTVIRRSMHSKLKSVSFLNVTVPRKIECTCTFATCSRGSKSFTAPTNFVKLKLYRRTNHLFGSVAPISTSHALCSEGQNIVQVSDYIPEPPPVPPSPELPVAELVENLTPTLESLGLGGWWPPGIVQECLYYLHTSLDMPWWLAIVTGTLVIRTLMFPLVVKAQQNSAHMHNNMPQMQILQLKMTEARKSGNAIEAARYAHELMHFMKEKKVNPIRGMIVPLVQAPVFLSVFFGLRKMANVPVESFKDGGLFWFTNLTICDPYYILPIITCTTLFVTIEIGAEGGIRTDSMQLMRYVLRALPVVIFPFIINFPAAILVYWCTSNFITLGQVAVMRLPPVRKYLNIPVLQKHHAGQVPKKKGFVEGIKESMTNSKIVKEIEERHRVDEMRFKKAGMGPLVKTYPYDPTKQRIAAKPADSRGSATKK